MKVAFLNFGRAQHPALWATPGHSVLSVRLTAPPEAISPAWAFTARVEAGRVARNVAAYCASGGA